MSLVDLPSADNDHRLVGHDEPQGPSHQGLHRDPQGPAAPGVSRRVVDGRLVEMGMAAKPEHHRRYGVVDGRKYQLHTLEQRHWGLVL